MLTAEEVKIVPPAQVAVRVFPIGAALRRSGFSVAQWKRLTGTDGAKIEVNMDAIAFMRPDSGATQIVFGDRGGTTLAILVKELIDEIQRTPTVR